MKNHPISAWGAKLNSVNTRSGNLWVIPWLLKSAFFILLSSEINSPRCKVFWRICTKGTRKPKLNRIKFRLNHQENCENLFSEMLSQDMERMDNMDMMSRGVLTFQLIGLLQFVVTLMTQSVLTVFKISWKVTLTKRNIQGEVQGHLSIFSNSIMRCTFQCSLWACKRHPRFGYQSSRRW